MLRATDYKSARVEILELLRAKASLAIGERQIRLETAIEKLEDQNEHEPAAAALRSELTLTTTTPSEKTDIQWLLGFVTPGGC